jgi:hypothetical protein
MAREAGMVVHDQDQPYMEILGRFAELVKQNVQIEQMPKFEALAELIRKDERNRAWTRDHWTDYERSIAAAEREACAKVCEQLGASTNGTYERLLECAAAIRTRGSHA